MTFRLGINYWPAAKAMYWWRRFVAAEVARDFARIRKAGFDSVRIFLLWEDFQPEPGHISEMTLTHLLKVADMAATERLSLVPTLFTGHMSGVNWLPAWAVDTTERSGSPGRFRTISGGRLIDGRPRNWYADTTIRNAQALLAREVAQALRNHPALWAYDLGNENSNCVVPPRRELAVEWLDAMAAAIRSADGVHPITIGLHAEDLEEDRRLGPLEAGRVCDFLSMHGYPIYLAWAETVEDEEVLPFLGLITQWLGAKDVLFEEFGAPSATVPPPSRMPMLDLQQAARYTGRALDALYRAGFAGAMIWCFADYDTALWCEPPLDHAPHERYFGLWGERCVEKPALQEIQKYAGLARRKPCDVLDWIDMRPEDFYRDPTENLRRLYHRFRECCLPQDTLCFS